MAVTRGNAAVSAEATGSNNADVSYDAGSGPNRVMVAISGTMDTGANNDNEYPAGSAMPHISGRGSHPSCSLEIDTSPAEGANTLRSFGDSGIAVVGMAFLGASGWGNGETGSGSSTSPTITVDNTDPDGLVCFTLVHEDNATTISDEDGATIEEQIASGAADARVVIATKAGTGGSVSWSPTLSALEQWWIAGFTIDPSAADFPLNNRRRHR